MTYTSKNVSLLYLEHCVPKVEINSIFILHNAHTLQIQLTSVDINNSCSLAIVSVDQLISDKTYDLGYPLLSTRACFCKLSNKES